MSFELSLSKRISNVQMFMSRLAALMSLGLGLGLGDWGLGLGTGMGGLRWVALSDVSGSRWMMRV